MIVTRDIGAGASPRAHQHRAATSSVNELARTALYEAAHTLLVRSRKWSTPRAWGTKIAKRRAMARARVAVARKLAVVLHRMWSAETEFRFGKEPGAIACLAAA